MMEKQHLFVVRVLLVNVLTCPCRISPCLAFAFTSFLDFRFLFPFFSSVFSALLASSFFFTNKFLLLRSPHFSSRSLSNPILVSFKSFKFEHFPLVSSARLPPVRVEESSFSQDLQWLLERGVQFADVAFYAGDSGKELGWAHASVLCAISPYFRQLLVGRQAWERPVSRCTCRERDGPHSLMSTWDGGVDDLPRADGHPSGHISRLVVKDPLLCLCLWETLMFLYRGETV